MATLTIPEDSAGVVVNWESDTTVNGGSGNDTIKNAYSTSNVVLDGKKGNDFIGNWGKTVSISGGSGNDIIANGYAGGASADSVTINGGKGNDSIYLCYDSSYRSSRYTLIQYSSGDGKDKIYYFDGDDTLSISGGEYSTTKSGKNIIVTVGEGKITLIGAASLSTVNIKGTLSGGDNIGVSINNSVSNTLLTGTSEADSIENHGYKVTISTGNGDDTVYNDWEDDSSTYFASINTGAGNDDVYNSGGWHSTINTGDGNDYVSNVGNWCTINTGEGNDSVYNFFIGDYVTINTGKGNDSIRLDSDVEYNVIIYKPGDGNDKIRGFDYNDTLSIVGGSYSTAQSGDDIIVTVGDGKISLIGAAYEISDNNIVFTQTVEANSWTLDGTTAKYGTSSKTLITVKGVKSTDGLSLNDKVVTVSTASVNKKKITISGDGYTLALADDVTAPTTSKKWSLDDSTATYNQIKTAGYTLANNAKSISYSKKSTTTLATVKGVKSLEGLSINGKVITVAESSVNKKKITLTSDGYTLKLAEGLTPTTKKAAWSYKNGTATYKSSYKTDGYKLAKNSKSITYSKATTATTLATIKGAKSTSGLSVSGKKITLKNSALSKKVTVSGGYEFDFAKDYGTATITGSSKADTITARGKKISVNGGKGDDTIKILGSGTVSGGDGADIFYYKSSGSNVIADYAAEDKISIASGTTNISTSGNDLIFTIGSGKISVTGGANQTVTYFDANGEHIYKKASGTLEGVKFTKSGKVVTLTDDYEADRFDVADFSNYKNKIVTINAAKVSQALEIIGNKKSNVITGTTDKDKIYGLSGADTIRGGKGGDYIEGGDGDDEIYGGEGSDSLWGGDDDDILTGGAGKDFFIYEGNDDGNDTITDYADIDSIMILSGEKPALAYTPQSNNMTFNIGNGSIVIENPQGQNINFVKGDGTYLHHEAVIRSAH